MAAFINALAEEGTRDEVLHYVVKQRRENGLPPEGLNDWSASKDDLIGELQQLWNRRTLRLTPSEDILTQRERIVKCTTRM